MSIIGQTLGRSRLCSFGIELQGRHLYMYAIGRTGSGKSTLLLNLVLQDIRVGHGLCLIDPYGDLAEMASSSVSSDHLYWNTAEHSCPYGYNPLTHVSAGYRPLVASGLIETLKKQWSDAWRARMEHLLRYATLALLERPKSSVEDIMQMFLDKRFRAQVVEGVTDDQVRTFWTNEFDAMRYKGAVNGVAPIANKLGAFLAHPVVRSDRLGDEDKLPSLVEVRGRIAQAMLPKVRQFQQDISEQQERQQLRFNHHAKAQEDKQNPVSLIMGK